MPITARILTVVFLLSPVVALAQTAPAPLPLVVERVHTPFVIAPDYKVTDLNGERGQLAGGFVGRLYDDVLFVGGAGYWLANGRDGEEFAYGGLLVGWSTPQVAGIRLGARGLVGAGSATLGREVTVARGVRDPRRPSGTSGLVPATVRVLARDDFFVFEPQVNVVASVAPHVAVNLAGGYRVTGFTDTLEGSLNGATGSVALQFQW